MKKPVMAAALAFAALLSITTIVVGHAELESADPRDGETIVTPYLATLWFSEVLTPDGSSVVVQDSSGAQVASGTVLAADAKRMEFNIPQLPTGQYTVLWTAVTADDKGVTRGTYTFNVGGQATVEPALPTTLAPTPAASSSTNPTTGGGSDLLIPLAAVVVIVVAIAGYLLYRNRS